MTYLGVSIRMWVVDTKESGRLGGAARARRLTPGRRSEIARAAVRARWNRRGVMEQGQAVTALALNANWLDEPVTVSTMMVNAGEDAVAAWQIAGTQTGGEGAVTTTGCYTVAAASNFPYTTAENCYYPWYSYPVYVSSPSRPIRLTMSEVERLRKLAKADEKVKAILAKFTESIEIVVDFA